MIARLLISLSLKQRIGEIEKILSSEGLKNPHPDLLYFPKDSKLGIEQARAIKKHFSLKPYQSKGIAVVMDDASNLTIEAQNALLKTLEEPPKDAILILAAPSDAKFLPTILSRCEIIKLTPKSYDTLEYHSLYEEDLNKLLASTIEERFEYIEKLKDREEFLIEMVKFFHHQLNEPNTHVGGRLTNLNQFLQELLQAEEWAAQNVNIRTILEYLMLVMPQKS